MVKVSIIILAFNRIDLTLEVLKDISTLKTKDLEVDTIVVDNASKDGTSDKLKKFKLPNMPFQLITNSVNLGFAGGNNIGLARAINNGADFCLLLNNDVILSRDLLLNLMTIALKNDQVSEVAPKIYFAKGSEFHKNRYKPSDLGRVIWYAGGKIDRNNVLSNHVGVDEVDNGQHDQEKETDFANGACVLIRTKALMEAGLLNEKYFLYWEDVELSQRLKIAGWKIIFSPKAYLWHKVSIAAGGIGGEANDYFLTRNRLTFGLKYSSLRTKAALIRESLRILFKGTLWQRQGVKDFYLGKMGIGSWGK